MTGLQDPFAGFDNSRLLEGIHDFNERPGPATSAALIRVLQQGVAHLLVQYEEGSYRDMPDVREVLTALRLTSILEEDGQRLLVVFTSWAKTRLPPAMEKPQTLTAIIMRSDDLLLLCDLQHLDGLMIDMDTPTMAVLIRPHGPGTPLEAAVIDREP